MYKRLLGKMRRRKMTGKGFVVPGDETDKNTERRRENCYKVRRRKRCRR